MPLGVIYACLFVLNKDLTNSLRALLRDLESCFQIEAFFRLDDALFSLFGLLSHSRGRTSRREGLNRVLGNPLRSDCVCCIPAFPWKRRAIDCPSLLIFWGELDALVWSAELRELWLILARENTPTLLIELKKFGHSLIVEGRE